MFHLTGDIVAPKTHVAYPHVAYVVMLIHPNQSSDTCCEQLVQIKDTAEVVTIHTPILVCMHQ